MQIIKDSLIYKVKLKKYGCLLACNNTNGNKNKKAYSKNIFCGITVREIGHVISAVDNYPFSGSAYGLLPITIAQFLTPA